MSASLFLAPRALLAPLLLLFATVSQAGNDIAPLLATRGATLTLHGVTLWSTPFLRQLYADEARAPRWRPAQLAVLRKAVDAVVLDGLDPEDFLASQLALLDELPLAAREVIATEALARLAFTLRFGKANPETLEPDWNYTRSFGETDPTAWLRDAILAKDLAAELDGLRPTDAGYRALVEALGMHRVMAAVGGWPTVTAGETLKPGVSDPRIVELRARLDASDEGAPLAPSADPQVYDVDLVKAVENFQRRQGLYVDGAVGKGTLAALNLPVEARIDQLRVNLERMRWVFRDVEDEMLAVNIAAFEAVYTVRGEVRWRGRAIVGRPYRQTPIFKDRLSYVELNPSWTVPPTILKEDILPKLRVDPGYLKTKKLKLVDYDGREVAVSSVDLGRGRGFPYILRQEPGPENPLGRLAFMFPNVHAVYLHDTPSRELFAQAERAFSSGCIRVENPLALARLLLEDDPRWQGPALDKALERGRNQRINLPRRVSIMLLYMTAFADEAGVVQFRKDVYGRDQRVLAALAAPLRWEPPRDFKLPDTPGI
ncbi:MAG: L,D-transpeptidase family protein [Gammaproteobacteria bacterium]|nr:L,D-transpeptidase family protein [Gammaproteobacteria bacterium]